VLEEALDIQFNGDNLFKDGSWEFGSEDFLLPLGKVPALDHKADHVNVAHVWIASQIAATQITSGISMPNLVVELSSFTFP